MTEIEVPLEKVSEDIHHAAMHAAPEAQRFVNRSALMSAILAGFAAVSALFAGQDANEAMVEQIRSADQWALYQAKGVKAAIAELQATSGSDEAARTAASQKVERYRKEQEGIKENAEELEKRAEALLHRHEGLAASVTFFQIAIALTAIAVLTRKTSFLVIAAATGGLGIGWLVRSFFF